jgi:hypothetical protein
MQDAGRANGYADCKLLNWIHSGQKGIFGGKGKGAFITSKKGGTPVYCSVEVNLSEI